MKKVLIILTVLLVSLSLTGQERISLDSSLIQINQIGGVTDDTINGLRLRAMTVEYVKRTVVLEFEQGEIVGGVFTPSDKRESVVVRVSDRNGVMTAVGPWDESSVITLSGAQRTAILNDLGSTRTLFLNGVVDIGAVNGTVE